MAPKPGLARTQRWMQSVIMHPGSDEEAIASEVAQAVVPAREFPKVVLPSKTLTSFERLGIYLYLYSDGLTEAVNLQGEGFGEDRLLRTIEESRSRPLQESLCYILDRVQEWSSGTRLEDDVSLLALEMGVD